MTHYITPICCTKIVCMFATIWRYYSNDNARYMMNYAWFWLQELTWFVESIRSGCDAFYFVENMLWWSDSLKCKHDCCDVSLKNPCPWSLQKYRRDRGWVMGDKIMALKIREALTKYYYLSTTTSSLHGSCEKCTLLEARAAPKWVQRYREAA